MKGSVEVSPAPDLRGASMELESHSNNFRARGGIRMGDEHDRADGMKLTNDLSVHGSTSETDIMDYKKSKLEYVFESFPVYGAFTYIHKFDLLELGVEVGLDDDLYISGLFGVNTKYFDVGFSAFAGTRMSNVNSDYIVYERSECDWVSNAKGECSTSTYSDHDQDDQFVYILGYGGYVTGYLGRFSLTYSATIQHYDNPYSEFLGDVKSNNRSLKTSTEETFLPVIVTNHVSFATRITKHIILRTGFTNVVGDFEGWHLFNFVGAEFLW